MKLKRKKTLPILILTILLWSVLGWLIYSYPPNSNFLIFAFFFLFFLASFLTGALIFTNSRRGFFISTFLTLFLLFRYFKIANFLNILLLGGIFLSLEIYFSKK